MAPTEKKRKRVVLTIEEKVKVLDNMLDKSVSYFHFTYLNKFSYLNTSKFSVPKGVRITEVLLYGTVTILIRILPKFTTEIVLSPSFIYIIIQL